MDTMRFMQRWEAVQVTGYKAESEKKLKKKGVNKMQTARRVESMTA